MTRRNTGGFLSAKEQATDSNSANGIFTLSEAAALTTGGNFPTGGFSPTNSVRFRANAGAHFNTAVIPAVGSTTTYSWFGWIKLGQIGTTRRIFSCGTNPGGVAFYLSSSDTLNLSLYIQNAEALNTTQVLRDPSAWYHVGFSVDTTQTIASNRVKFFINGTQVTSFSATNYPTQNTVTQVNGGVYNHFIGRESFSASNYFDGYMSEVYFIDGQALSASSFGQTDPATGAWIPKKYTGTFGTNGFYLPFNRTDVTFNMDYLVVAGGGGGGSASATGTGGGGGAGGYLAYTGATLSTGTYRVTVGSGGAASTNGSNSVFASTITVGGGAGGVWNTSPGQTGGSGGGGAAGGGGGANTAAGSGTASQGNAGGSGGTSNAPAGGGGGAGAAGTAGNLSNAGSGGIGLASSISGVSTYYAGGSAGGSAGAAAGTGGLGGGVIAQTSAAANTGAGGGGAYASGTGGSGGSGIVIIKIPDTRSASFSSGVTYSGGTPSGGFKIYSVTSTSTTTETVTFS